MDLKHTAKKEGRLSTVLKMEMGVSTGLMNRLKWKDKLLVNGVPRHTDYAVQPGDVITVLLEEPQPNYPAEDGPLTILYEDAHILAVDKPAGILIHPSRATMTGTLANRVLGHYRRTGQESAFHPVTRLDRDTFGIVLLAKNAHIHARLNEANRCGKLHKTYHAIVYGEPPNKVGVIEAPLARKPLPSLLRYVSVGGKPAKTEFFVMEQRETTAVLALRPITGRTHQLRVHCAYMGHPIVGDPQYYNSESQLYSKQLGLESQLLCAKALQFMHPVTGQFMILESRMDVV